MEQKPFLYFFSSAASQTKAYSEVLSQMTAHLRIGSPLKAGEFVGFKPGSVGLQSGAATSEPPLLPLISFVYESSFSYAILFMVDSNSTVLRINF